MKTYLATYGTGSRRLFDAVSRDKAKDLAYAYGCRNNCGMLILVEAY